MDLNRALKFWIPTKIISGPGSSSQVGAEAMALEAQRVLLVTDEGVRAAGVTQSVEDSLKEKGLEYAVFDDVPVDPDTLAVDQGAAFARDLQPDLVVAVGGGSPICLAKGVALLMTNGGSLHDHPGVGRHTQPPLPLIAVPTTAGSGSEISAKFIITNERDHFKMTWGGSDCFPAAAILDAELLLSLPYWPALYASLDAISHAVDGYLSKGDTPLTDALALGAIEVLCWDMIPAAGTDQLLAKQRALLASSMANMACGMAGLGLVHGLTLWCSSIPHGLACALTMPHVMAFNLPARPEKVPPLARALGGDGRESIEEVVALLTRLYRQAGVPKQMPEGEVPSLEEMVQVTLKHGQRLLSMNYRRASRDDIETLLRQAWEGWA